MTEDILDRITLVHARYIGALRMPATVGAISGVYAEWASCFGSITLSSTRGLSRKDGARIIAECHTVGPGEMSSAANTFVFAARTQLPIAQDDFVKYVMATREVAAILDRAGLLASESRAMFARIRGADIRAWIDAWNSREEAASIPSAPIMPSWRAKWREAAGASSAKTAESGWIYVVQADGHIGSDIYKVGRTAALGTRVPQYGPGVLLFCAIYHPDVKRIEREILAELKSRFKLAQGREYFHADGREFVGAVTHMLTRA